MDPYQIAKLAADYLFDEIQAQVPYLLYLLIGTLVVSLISSGLNVFFQFRLKRHDVKNQIEYLRAQKRINIFHEINGLIEEISTQTVENPSRDDQASADLIERIRQLRRLSTANRLSLTKQSIRVVDEFADYFAVILTDFKKKNVQREEKLFSQLKKEYERL